MIAKTMPQKLALVGSTLGVPEPTDSVASLAMALPLPSQDVAYLLLAVILERIPKPAEVVSANREWRLDGASSLLSRLVRKAPRRRRFGQGIRVSSGMLVDVHDTARQPFTTGIQRVVRSTLPILARSHDLELIAWTEHYASIRSVTPGEASWALGGGTGVRSPRAPELIVPFRATYLLPEIAVNRRRATAMHSIAEFSGSKTIAIGHDCIAVTTAETTGPGMPAGFSRYLAALAHFNAVLPTSEAARVEFAGWKAMLEGAGIGGPALDVVGLPVSKSVEVTAERVERTRAELKLGNNPVVLAVGSHEPRKNHLVLLHACELAWRRGAQFTLVMVGGNAWNAEEFRRVVKESRMRGRRVVTLTAASDQTVTSLYRIARFSVFPSLNEGFGLPIVESIAQGTPVVTSNFGSMRELAEGVGGVLIDPRDEHALSDVIVTLLTDDELLASLGERTAGLRHRGWNEYAQDLSAAIARN